MKIEKDKTYLPLEYDSKCVLTPRLIKVIGATDTECPVASMYYFIITNNGNKTHDKEKSFLFNTNFCRFGDGYILMTNGFGIADSKQCLLKMAKFMLTKAFYGNMRQLPFEQNMRAYGEIIRGEYRYILEMLKKIKYNDVRRT